ncbi:MX1 [Acanthosepion pharaonis]|uniref:MX1 n=1 Tax=Acanthosepion pharaonis TaxID=158019 RepID=A0A812EUG3_ACAPH|nr:MX1 [Sepia pharaonis]
MGYLIPIAVKDTTNICGSFLLSGIFLLYLGDYTFTICCSFLLSDIFLFYFGDIIIRMPCACKYVVKGHDFCQNLLHVSHSLFMGYLSSIAVKDTCTIRGRFLPSDVFVFYLGDVIIQIRVRGTRLFCIMICPNIYQPYRTDSSWVSCLPLQLRIPAPFVAGTSSQIFSSFILVMSSFRSVFFMGSMSFFTVKDTCTICGRYLLSDIFVLYFGDVIIQMRRAFLHSLELAYFKFSSVLITTYINMPRERENNLPQIFNQNVRPFLDAIDNLRKFGLDEDLKLPTFVVIGDQSSGKSSILEAISGVQLPRGTGIVTRCPLQLQMKQVKSKKWRATLSYRVDDSEVTNVLKKPSEIDNAIRQAQNEVTGQKDGISETLLTLSIEDKYVPDLTLIDLPGIARVSVGGQAADVPEQIMRLIKKYISREEALILTVCPCTTDLATTEALKLSQEYDPDCERTFGVLTKADLIDKGNEESILKILNNEVIPLSKGYTIVKCRGQSALLKNESLKETLEKEKIFFQNHDVFRNLDKSQWGIETLSRKLAYDLFSFIKRELPTIRKTIIEKQKIMSDELLNDKVNYPTTPETRLMYTLTTTNKFLKTFGELTEGKYHSQELEKIEDCLNRSKHVDMRLIPFILSN